MYRIHVSAAEPLPLRDACLVERRTNLRVDQITGVDEGLSTNGGLFVRCFLEEDPSCSGFDVIGGDHYSRAVSLIRRINLTFGDATAIAPTINLPVAGYLPQPLHPRILVLRIPSILSELSAERHARLFTHFRPLLPSPRPSTARPFPTRV